MNDVVSAARNNAEWCAAMATSHGLASHFGTQAWTAPARTPLFYPDAVTLVPNADITALLTQIDTTTPGASIKDSFADLDLTPAGFHILFEAQWIHRPPTAPESDLPWAVADTPASLHDWALAWDDGAGNAALFRPALLKDPATFVLAGRSPNGDIVAGAIATHTAHGVGISNVFGDAWPFILNAAHHLFPAQPLLGYEQGDDLTTALQHGFATTGPLRVWLHT
ncbi:hypothetical protein J4573_47525 [Actinomadura barringtoniae]|uniref:Uncharacterized protein n=1 Tax=Actinomadura barringtoniae TaxID=1427535 RepID=A0A939PL59_9ACTN|nr:hypothetical protein [Actinomadura barringtoniae]MBO2454811.1 hypothetical protein [Actinomadura barringtoniae]